MVDMDKLTVLAWNVYVANDAANVRRYLTDWIEDFDPHVVALTEARTHRAVLQEVAEDLGYSFHQATPIPGMKDGIVNDDGDSAIMVRKRGVKIKHQRTARMARGWVYSPYMRRHTPRSYEVAKIKVGKKVWRVRSSHFPTEGFDGRNKAAFRESALRSKAWMLASGRRTSSIDVGDFNTGPYSLKQFLGDRFVVVGEGIDLLLGRRIRGARKIRLGKGGGDHHAAVYRVTA